MTIEEWAKDFKSYVNALDMQRDDYKGIMEYIDDALAVLKEQEEQIKSRDESLEKAREEIKWLRGMLKEQEAVVHPEPSCEMTYITDCCCDLCGVQLIREDIFCRCCGKRIEWEGR